MDARSSASSPYQSLGDRPEMELDLWEGQFNLSSLAGADDEDLGLGGEGRREEDLLEMYSSGATCWGEDSSVTMGTVRSQKNNREDNNMFLFVNIRFTKCKSQWADYRRSVSWRSMK